VVVVVVVVVLGEGGGVRRGGRGRAGGRGMSRAGGAGRRLARVLACRSASLRSARVSRAGGACDAPGWARQRCVRSWRADGESRLGSRLRGKTGPASLLSKPHASFSLPASCTAD
jgi:hypothetical protein